MKLTMLVVAILLCAVSVFALDELPKEMNELTTKWNSEKKIVEITIDDKTYTKPIEDGFVIFGLWTDDMKVLTYKAKDGNPFVHCAGEGDGCNQANKNAIAYVQAWGAAHN